MAWVKPLFLPSPGATLNAFMSTLPGQTQGDTPLIQHIGISVMRVLNASNFLRTDIVLMGIVVIGVLAYAFDLLMRQLEKIVTPWKGKV